MNLTDMREELEEILSHAPQVKQWRESFRKRANRAASDLATERPWPWREKSYLLPLKAEVVLTSADYTANTATSGAFGFEFTVPTGWSLWDVEYGLTGHVVEISGNTGAYLVAQRANRRFIIEESGLTAGGAAYIILDPNYDGNTVLTGAETLTIKFERYWMPRDCMNILSIVMRDTEDGRIRAMSNAREFDMMLNSTDPSGTPTVFLDTTNFATTWNERSGEDYPHIRNEAPIEPPTLAQSAGGSLVVGSTYDYRYAWEYGGIVSEPSPMASITMTTGNGTVALTAMDVLDDAERGRVRHVFRRKDEGPWYKISTNSDPTVATASDAGTFTTAIDPTTLLREREYHTGGLPRSVRFWPLTDTDIEVEVRYLRKPLVMEHGGDEPDMPPEYHSLLVYRMAADILAESDAKDTLVAHYERLYSRKLSMLMGDLEPNDPRNVRASILSGHSTELVVGTVTYTE